MTRDEEIAALKARITALEKAAAPPEPFTPEPLQRFDPTARMAMPESTLAAMIAAVPDHVMKDVIAKGGIQPPSGAGASGTISSVHQSPGLPGSTGWRPEVPFGPQPGINYIDRMLDEQDRRDRAELVERIAQAQRVDAAIKEGEG
jgi:hypothetical protein